MTNEELKKAAWQAARDHFGAFVRCVWWNPHNLVFGRHTYAICDRLTKAVEDWEKGKSTYLLINVPFRHGKSDLVSRAFPAWFLGRCATKQPDVIMATYASSLTETFARQCKNIIRSFEYRQIFPGVAVDRNRDSVDSWGIQGSSGYVTCVGLGGAITGKGGNLIVLDDYVKNREEAYSVNLREKLWDSFSADLMTRQNAPAAIVICCATPWHVDDITGRILDSVKRDPQFPKFERLIFPARKEGPDGYETLFPELYDEEWYRTQRASLGPSMAAALLDCDPVTEGNRMFKAEWIQTTDRRPDASDMNIIILVDSANSKKEGKAADPDYTSMQVWGLARDRNYYLLDGYRDRLDLEGRTELIFQLVKKWQPINVFWESVGAMADTQHVKIEQDHRGYHFRITELKQRVPKIDRIGWLAPIFETGKIWLPTRLLHTADDGSTYDFVRVFIDDEYSTAPAGRHDDMIDCMANLQHPTVLSMVSFPHSRASSSFGARGISRASEWRPF